MARQKITKSELNRRYSLISVGTVLLCIVIFSIVQTVLMDDVYLAVVKLDMQDSATKIGRINFHEPGYEKLLADIEADDHVYIEIYHPRDTLIYTTKSNESIYDTTPDIYEESTAELKPRIMKILQRTENEDGSYFELRQEYFATAEYIVYGCFFNEEYDDDMALEMYYSADLIRENSEIASTAIFHLSLVVMVLIISASIRIGVLVFMPLHNMIDKTKRMANLDFSAKCPDYKIKELNELSQSINALSSSLSDALGKLQSKNRQLETDILMERKQEKARKSFISNVSHELKTPIAIIKGYAEGMKIGVGCDSTEEFCDIIIEESDKMNALIMRLMEYMKLSAGAYKLYSADFNLLEVLSDCVTDHHHRILEKDIAVIMDINPEYMAYSDPLMIQNIFSNYISNAISHIDFDKIIRVTADDMGTSYRVRVFNTGKQIPGTDIENIWQSFYRADKAHSREEGRFGLGLSFVATIQEMTGEKYGVENKVDGVEFWFDVKKKV